MTQRIARKPWEKIKPSEPCGLKTAYPEFYEEAILLLGIRSFFGVVVSGSKLVHDEQQPNMFEQWKSERERR